MSDPRVGRGAGCRAWKWQSIGCAAAFALGFILAQGGSSVGAQESVAGSIDGKLTDAYSRPLGGVRITLRNATTGAAFQTITAKSGTYRLAGMAPGVYVLEACSEQLGSGRTSGVVITAGHAARVQTALSLRRGNILPTAVTADLRPWPPAQPASPAPAIQNALNAVNVGTPHPVIAAGSGAVRLASGSVLADVLSVRLIAALQLDAEQMRVPPMAQSDSALASAELEQTIPGEDLQALPLAVVGGEAFRLDTPPEVPVGGEAELADHRASVSGDRTAGRVDGMSTRLAFGRGTGRRDPAAFIGPAATEATIREVQVIARSGVDVSGFPGSAGGGVLTRSGADLGQGRLHGQVFLFDRQNLLNARNPFAPWVRETAPASSGTVPMFGAEAWSPADTALRWGAAAGGPLRRNRLYWYGAFSQERRNEPEMATVRHPDQFFATPSNDEMQVLSARLDLSSADPVGEGLGAYSTMLETLAGLLGPVPRSSMRSTGFGRLDWKWTERHRFRLEASGIRWDAPGGGLTRVAETYGNHSFAAARSREIWVMGAWDAVLTPNLVAVTQGAFGRYALQHPAANPSAFEESLNVNAWGQLPQMVVDSRYGFSIGNAARFGAGTYPMERQLQARETLEWMHRGIAFRAGAEFRHDADATSFLRNHTGTYHYARIENFASDALAFTQFGLADTLNPLSEHYCDERAKAWRDAEGRLHGMGHLPCYSYYTQAIGPTDWHLETNDVAGFTTATWQARPGLTFSAGLRWARQMLPPPIDLVHNPDLPDAGKLPDTGNEWAPRVGIAFGSHESRLPVLTLGYGMYYGRVQNRTLEEALTQTGSAKGDLKLFLRPTDNLMGRDGGAPPFPYVLAASPGPALTPGISQVDSRFRNGEVHQAVASAEERLPANIRVTLSAVATLGRRLPITMDTNFDPQVNPGTITYQVEDPAKRGPIKTPLITVPFFAAWPASGQSGGRLYPAYQEVTGLFSRANSTYEAGVLRISRGASRGISFNLRYTYGHAMDWDPNESGFLSGGDLQDPMDFRQEYGTSNLDIRHSTAGYAIWRAPWKLTGSAGTLTNGWMLSGIGQFHSGLPYSMRTAGAIPQLFQNGGGVVVGLGPGMNGYGGADRVYGVGRNSYRYPSTWKADMRVGKRFALGHARELELMGESFNLLNHRNVTEIETVGYTIDTASKPGSLPRLKFLTDAVTGQSEFGQPLNVNATDYYRERQVDFGLRLRFKHSDALPVD